MRPVAFKVVVGVTVSVSLVGAVPAAVEAKEVVSCELLSTGAGVVPAVSAALALDDATVAAALVA